MRYITAIISIFIISTHCIAGYNCGEYSGQSGWILCEDFETGSFALDEGTDYIYEDGSAREFPHEYDAEYHDMTVGDYGHDGDNRISSALSAGSGSYSLKMEKTTTSSSGIDIELPFGDRAEVYIRWYWYVPSGFTYGSGGAPLSNHNIFIHTAVHAWLSIEAFTSYAVGADLVGDCETTEDFFNHSSSGLSKLYPVIHGYGDEDCGYTDWNHDDVRGACIDEAGGNPCYYQDEDTENTYWRFYDHEGEWHCFEFYGNNTNHTTKLWIDGVLQIETTAYDVKWGPDIYAGTFLNGFDKVIFSNYSHDTTFANIMYYDNIVVSTSYIGPIGSSAGQTFTGMSTQ